MSKLSFRARALDANKSLPVFHAEDVPDLPDIASVNRVVPQMPTGMEKEEESEHHLQRAITAQQIYGEAQRLIIPTPDTLLFESDYKKLKKVSVHIPKQFIHVQAFTLEDELPDYDCDESDMEWMGKYNKINPGNSINALELEKMIDTIERGCGSRIELFTLSDAQALLRKNEKLVSSLYEYWKFKKLECENNPLTPSVRTEKKDGNTFHDPYVAFRRRIEKMQTRKNRKNDEASYEKMLRLRRDLNRACTILEMVKLREQQKRDLLQTTIRILEMRSSTKDFTGELLHQCYDLLKNRPIQPTEQSILRLSSFNNNNNVSKPILERHRKYTESVTPEDHIKRNETNIEENRKRQQKLKQQSTTVKIEEVSSSETVTTNLGITGIQPKVEPTHYDGPDGKYSFRRKKGVFYHAPRYDSIGNWPWMHPVEGGTPDPRFCYCYSSITKKKDCIKFARRRIGRGGRYIFDRAYTPYNEFMKIPNICKNNDIVQDRAPPWPHFKPNMDSSSSDDEESSNMLNNTNCNFNRWSQKDSLYKERSNFKPNHKKPYPLSSASKLLMHPYTIRTSNPNSSVNNQTFLASVAASRLAKTKNRHNLILSAKSRTGVSNSLSNQYSFKKSHNFTQHSSPSRHASIAPASAIYQLNFPLDSSSTNKNKVVKAISTISNNTNNKITPTGTFKNDTKTCIETIINHVTSTTLTSFSSNQAMNSRQPLGVVQERSFVRHKVIPSTTNHVQLSNLQGQPVNSLIPNKLSISKGLSITHSAVVSNCINVSKAGIQAAR